VHDTKLTWHVLLMLYKHIQHAHTFAGNAVIQAEHVVALMQGEHAHRVWNLIYSQSCFTDIAQADVCTERKVFYRLISGEAKPSQR